MIKAIIFDYYGVITTDQYLTWLERNPEVLAHHEAEIEQLSKDQDLGLTLEEFNSRLASIAGLSVGDIRDGLDIHTITHEALIHYIAKLRKLGLKTAILSNSSTDLYQIIADHQLNKYFDLILCSGEAGVVKPHPDIYRLALKRLGVEPSEAIFIDDRSYNVAGAEAVGIDGILYHGLTELETELSKRSIIVK